MEEIKEIVFVVEDAIFENDGYKSRVEMEIGLLGEDYKYYVLVPDDSRELAFRYPIEIIRYKGFSNKYPFLFNKRALSLKLKETLTKLENPIVYCEALPSAVAVYGICKELGIKYVFDCHGTAPDEAYLYHQNVVGKVYSDWLRKKQLRIVHNASLIITVSQKQYDEFCTERPYVLLPMIPSEQFFDEINYRCEYRKKLRIADDCDVFVYAGQNQKWQMSDETIGFYKRIEEKNAKAFLLVLTGSVDDFQKICLDQKIKNYKVLKAPYSEMPKYLDIADYGFCLRADHIINRVASPTKILEYLSRNVKPIITEYIGDFSENLKRHNLAAVVSVNDITFTDTIDSNINGRKYVEKLAYSTQNEYKKAISELWHTH